MNVPQHPGDFIAAILTPAGRGAVATVRVRGGVVSQFRPANGRELSELPMGRVVFGHWGLSAPEEVVVTRVDPLTLDVHCHGGHAPAARIVDDLRSTGAEIVDGWTMWARQQGPFEAECRRVLSLARTARTAETVLSQLNGLLKRGLDELIRACSSSPESAVAHCDALLSWADFGRHLTQPWRVAIAGRPNVGKSSLMNALVGFSRAIVFDAPGTTRDAITGTTALEGWPVELIDTAGLRDDPEPLEAAGIARARDVLETADCRVLLLDSSRPLEAVDRMLLDAFRDVITVAHKSDLAPAWDADALGGVSPLRVSSLTGAGVDALQALIVEQLVPAVPSPSTPVLLTEQQVAAVRAARSALVAGDSTGGRDAIRHLLTGARC